MQDNLQPRDFPHWMLREIFEQPETLKRTFSYYAKNGAFIESTNTAARRWIASTQGNIVIVASGSSRHAGLLAEVLIEDLSGIAVDVEYASEYCYRSERSMLNAPVMVVSQSGETADTLAALRKAIGYGHSTLAVTNVPDSTMAKEAAVSYTTLAGRERAIPATKSFTGQVMALHLLALLAAQATGALDTEEVAEKLHALEAVSDTLSAHLDEWGTVTRKIARALRAKKSFLFLGRDLHYPIAREGALKLKESSYLHAEGYPSGELKHGPNALVGEDTPLVMIATVDRSSVNSVLRYEKSLLLMRDMRAQGAIILAIANSGDSAVAALADHTISVPALHDSLLPFAEVIPMQMLSYFMAVQAGVDVDHPRNLVKAVVVE